MKLTLPWFGRRARRRVVTLDAVACALQSIARTDKTSRTVGQRIAGTGLKFNLIDKIEQLTDEKIVAVKYVSLAEEYLADHFPTFPVLPGVMMLEALTQAAAWVLHRRSGFAKSMAILKEARNVKYGQFVAPGNSLRVEVEFFKPSDAGAVFKAAGYVEQAQAVAARIEMSYFNLADKQPELAAIDARLIEHNKARWNVLNAGS
jgi:3-hydroxyacyl-[acyl-carrier-protein] dehydratase